LISTVPGSRSPGNGYSGGYGDPWVTVDGKGNLYITETEKFRVRKISPNGTIETVAGTGEQGFSGDGGPATSAKLFAPRGLAVDTRKNLYIAEYGSVRKVSPDGTITTFAGGGNHGYGDGGPATSAALNWNPAGVALDRGGSVYFSVPGNSNVRKVSRDGIITTVAGIPGYRPFPGYSGDGGPAISAKLSFPWGVAVDPQGNLYIADRGNHAVRKVSSTGTITTYAGNGKEGYSGDGGPASSAKLDTPHDVAVDTRGNVLIADTISNRVRRVEKTSVKGPDLILGGAPKQQLLANKGVKITASCSEACSLVAVGFVRILGTSHLFKLTPASAPRSAACTRTLTLRLSAAEWTRFRQLLKPGQEARALITVRATDKAGNTDIAKRTVAVR
jgi:hypothetical protein